MAEWVPFEDVLRFFESKDWKLQKIWGLHRVFMKQGELPWLVPVYAQKVSGDYVEKIEAFFRERERSD